MSMKIYFGYFVCMHAILLLVILNNHYLNNRYLNNHYLNHMYSTLLIRSSREISTPWDI